MTTELLAYLSATVALGLGLVVVVQELRLHRLQRRLAEHEGQPKPLKITGPTAAELEAKLKTAYEAQIANSVQVFADDLKTTSARLGEQVSRLTTTVIEVELTAYQQTLEQVRQSANEGMEKIRQAVEDQRVQLRQAMEAEVTTEREQLVGKFNTRMGDVVSSYIAESLGGGVDLGSQMQYIITSLEAHKEDIKKDLLS